jgi:hypothetical protein
VCRAAALFRVHRDDDDDDEISPPFRLRTLFFHADFLLDFDSSLDPEFSRPQLLPIPPPSRQMLARPRAPTPSASVPDIDSTSWSPIEAKTLSKYPSAPSIPDAPTPVAQWAPRSASHSHLVRSVSEGESSFLVDSARSFARPPKSMLLPDPSQFPDPYPFRPPHHNLTSALPALSYGGSSSASARSSAYTSSGSALASGDYGHILVATDEDDANIGLGITSDHVVQPLAKDGHVSSTIGRAPIDQTRWSESYSGSIRSRSSSVGNGSVYENGGPKLREKPSYDMNWQTVDERDEAGMSEGENDEDHCLVEDDEEEEEDKEEEEEDEKVEERTSAVVIAEEGRGLIVQGEGVPIVQLQVHSGTSTLSLVALKSSAVSFIHRHHPSFARILNDSEHNAFIPLKQYSSDLFYTPCPGYFCQLFGCTSAVSRKLYKFGGIERRIKPTSRSSFFSGRPLLSSSPYRGFNGHSHSPRFSQRARETSHPQH